MNAEQPSIHIGVNTLFLIPGEVGGTETYLCKTLDAICRQFPATRVTVFTNRENHLSLSSLLSKYSQTTVSRLNFYATNRYARILREQFELPAKARKVGIDVLWNPGYTAPIFLGCPQVVTIHDMQYKIHPEDLTWIARMTTDSLIKGAAKRAQQFITVSRFSKAEIIRFTSIPEDKIHVTPLAAEEIRFENKTRAELLKPVSKWVLPQESFILTVANSYPHKNLHTLIDAFGKIVNQIPHRLVIVGKPRRGERLVTKSLANLSEPGRVIRISDINREELIALYQGADLFVFPSLYEGFGLPVLEAMMCNVPVVTTTKASIPEVGGDFVVYVQEPSPKFFADAILDVLVWHSNKRSNFINAAKRWAKRFSWEKTASQTLDALMLTAKCLPDYRVD
jgi:glycosyltransferase involved in cell wall biosynthesis